MFTVGGSQLTPDEEAAFEQQIFPLVAGVYFGMKKRHRRNAATVASTIIRSDVLLAAYDNALAAGDEKRAKMLANTAAAYLFAAIGKYRSSKVAAAEDIVREALNDNRKVPRYSSWCEDILAGMDELLGKDD